MNMWHEMIPKLNEDECRILATKYDFSGGQIENIARHYTIGCILHGDAEHLPRILQDIDISGIIEQRINEMDMDEAEAIILDVMKKELRATRWRGALLGSIMGTVNALIL